MCRRPPLGWAWAPESLIWAPRLSSWRQQPKRLLLSKPRSWSRQRRSPHHRSELCLHSLQGDKGRPPSSQSEKELPKDWLLLSLLRWPLPDVRSKEWSLSHTTLETPRSWRERFVCQISKDEGAMQMHQSRSRCVIPATTFAKAGCHLRLVQVLKRKNFCVKQARNAAWPAHSLSQSQNSTAFPH